MPNEDHIEEFIENSDFVGGVFDMDYSTCKVHTNDYIKRNECGGLPKHSLLLAQMQGSLVGEGEDAEEESGDSEDDEGGVAETLYDHALLLRITGPTNLPIQEELTSARHRNIEEQLVEEIRGSGQGHELDALTQQELQKTAFEAEILGTFYYDEEGEFHFGSDAHTVFPSGEYMVYKPKGDVLSEIVSYLAAEDIVEEDLIDIGEVRYASTRLRADTDTSAPVQIDTNDLVGEKTAVFGMTGTGKSNSLKIIATAVHATQEDVGQLIFDPSGEYTPNDQDPIALSEIDDDIQVYEYPLGSNLLDPDNIDRAQREARNQIVYKAGGTPVPRHTDGFVNADILNPYADDYDGDFGEEARDKRRLAAFHAVLIHAGLEPHDDWWVAFPAGKGVRPVVERETDIELPKENPDDDDDPEYIEDDIELAGVKVGELQDGGGEAFIYNPEALDVFWTAVANNLDDTDYDEDDLVSGILEMIYTRHSGTGYLSELGKFHDSGEEDALEDRIYDRLTDGDIVIVDMTKGEESVVSQILNQTVEGILEKSVVRFNNLDESEDMPRIQIFLEEAHRYFEKDRFENEDDDPYVRLAKEGRKYQLGLVYATQEVSTVDDRVLANTKNWVVTHLNSRNETNNLTDYYDFEAFSRTIRKVDDTGYARVRTRSNSFTVPTQMRRFHPDWVEKVASLPADWDEDE